MNDDSLNYIRLSVNTDNNIKFSNPKVQKMSSQTVKSRRIEAHKSYEGNKFDVVAIFKSREINISTL